LAAPKKNARRLKATLAFVDEGCFALLPTACRTNSPRGHIPILRHSFSWPKPPAISAVTPHLQVYLHLVAATIASCKVIRFVRHLWRRIPGPLLLLWHGGNPIVRGELVPPWRSTALV